MRQDSKPALCLYETCDKSWIRGIRVVFDAQGQEVQVVVTGELQARNHEERSIREAPAFVDKAGHLLRIKSV